MAAQRTPSERWAAIENSREFLGLSWMDISRMSEVSPSTLNNYRKGRSPRPRILARIEAAMGVTDAASEMASAAE